MAFLALTPVSAAVYAVLNVGALTALATGGMFDEVPQTTAFPFVWYEVRERDVRGFGTRGLPEVTLRVHVYSEYEGTKEAQAIVQKVIELLRDQALTVAGYNHCGRVFYDDTVGPFDELINGVGCNELVASFRIYVEEAA